MTTTTNFATAKEVTSALSSLGFQPSVETIQTISRNCREQFLENLSKCITGQDVDGASKKMISNLLRSLSPDTLNKLKPIVPDVTADRIVPVVLKAPAKFLSAVDAASNPQHERHIDAKDFLKGVFAASVQDASPPPAAQDEPASPPSPTPHRYERPPQRDERPTTDSAPVARNRQAQGQAAADGKKYHSCHVYGSGYALCFNATEW